MKTIIIWKVIIFLIGVVNIILGIVKIKNPYGIYELKEKWKSRSNVEPSDDYIQRCKIGGVFDIIAGVFMMVLPLILEFWWE